MKSVQLACLTVLACGSSAPQPTVSRDTVAVHLAVVAEGFDSPVHLSAPTGDPRLFVVEQEGVIKLVKNGQVQSAPFLDIRSKVRSGGEQGLLSLAFHPAFSSNGYFFVDYTDVNGNTKVERYRVSANPDMADPASGKLILTVDQPYSNHNGGLVEFGPDKMLYVGMGDGGGGGDPNRNGQNKSVLLAKLLRLDVDHGDPYAIPPDNPFAGQSSARGEIWAYGLRNPWRYAFDRSAGLLYIADVGQNKWEEVDVVPVTQKGLNYGWNVMEGNHCYSSGDCSETDITKPVLEYGHSDGCSITGGFVYRGSAIPALQGTYFYADYCRGWIRSFKYANGEATAQQTWDFPSIGNVLSFGEDGAGELYVLSANGKIYKLTK